MAAIWVSETSLRKMSQNKEALKKNVNLTVSKCSYSNHQIPSMCCSSKGRDFGANPEACHGLCPRLHLNRLRRGTGYSDLYSIYFDSIFYLKFFQNFICLSTIFNTKFEMLRRNRNSVMDAGQFRAGMICKQILYGCIDMSGTQRHMPLYLAN